MISVSKMIVRINVILFSYVDENDEDNITDNKNNYSSKSDNDNIIGKFCDDNDSSDHDNDNDINNDDNGDDLMTVKTTQG